MFKELARCADVDGATVNDVIVACMGDDIHRYFREIGHDTSGRQDHINISLLVGFPKHPSMYLDEYCALSLQDAPILLTLWLRAIPPLERLRLTHDELRDTKDSNVTCLIAVLLDLIDAFMRPEKFVNLAQDGIGKASLALTNVPGPKMPFFLARHQIRELQLLVTNPFCNVQVMSYNEEVFINAQVNTRSSISTERIVESFETSVRAALDEFPLDPTRRDANLHILERAVNGNHPGPFLLTTV